MAEDVSIAVQVERDASQRDSLQVIGFVTRQGKSLDMLQGTQVILTSQAAEVSHDGTQYTQQIDELGNFVFSSIAPTTYMLELQLAGSNVVIEQLPVTLQG